MEFYFFEISLAIVAVIVTWMGCKAIKGIWTQVKRRISYMVGKSQDNQGVVNLNASESLASSSEPCHWKYDVFLSFRGPDTRKGITFDIYDRLNTRGIKTFMDDRDLEVGDAISPTLIAAIKESRFAIVVLSQNYASSTWCLEELREICLSMEDNRILPLFYHVDPTDVRYQKKGSFKEAFSKHVKSGRYTSEKVKEWRAALYKVANISGWSTTDHKTERGLVEAIVDLLSSKVVPDAIESTGDFQAFEATRQAMNEVMKALIDDKVTCVGVHGMGGVGKTTMVKHVAAQTCKNGSFNHWIMATISQNNDLIKIQDTLAELLGFTLQEKTEDGRATRLHKEILRREKLLIIMDDVWARTDLSRIGIPSYKELQKCKSKVLLTTRRLNVCHAMKCQEKISLNILSEEDSLTLFLRNARIMSFESPTFEKVVKRVAAECKGLPIALIAVARALGDKDPVEWEKAAQRLEKSQSANPDHEEDAFECIKLSYDYLKDEEYKSFFLLCSLFPEDDVINIEDLFRYAIGIGLFRDAETINEARGTAYTVVEHLKDSSLLLESDYVTRVRMHDVVRDTALNIAKSEGGHRFLVKAGCGLDDWPPISRLDEGCTAISLMSNRMRKLPPQLVCPKLQILLLNQNYGLDEIPETFFQTLNELRVLDLSRTGISYLPQSFGLLTNLRALYLFDCEKLRDISVVGKIMTLEVLSVKGANFMELSRDIGNLTNLRVLDFTNGWIFEIPSKLLSKLHSLEELYLRYRFGADFDEVTGLSKLRILHVCISNEECIPKLVERNPNWVGFLIWIGEYDAGLLESSQHPDIDQRTICLELDSIGNFPDWFYNTVIDKAEKLLWTECPRTGLIDVFVEYERGRLHSLKQLTVYGAEDEDEDDLMNTSTWVPKGIPKKKTWVPKEPLFENLEELHLLWLDCAELCAVEFLQPGSLCNLKLLEVCSCYNWGNVLLPSTLLERLPNLEQLKCEGMDEIEYVFGYEALLEAEQSKLRKKVLSDLETVRSLCEGPAPPAMFQNLQTLSIKSCNLQGSLFTYDVAQCLSQLNFLELHECPLLERIVEASNKKIILPKLKHLILYRLPVLYYESATFDIECPSLEELKLWGCPKFSVSVPDFHSRKQIQLQIQLYEFY
uniref:probable disease resistance protein At4g27220 isoform X1 n=1 Tax=Fragaria vesca subsp. vesca TaxID=101020 RepID=UPI0005C84777|nr:PREDICTED: probable disease resistance protein At4g27220 isoform X1 [Fragaria vesca subsp. vesca]XP_011461857.1 PREDICTED: probable disease resistance protein At4g27220 isoform X1 [Fragaria vesca subsp. vesca]XP_011461858.1 PREDICTED: probable disease resistance protein At4g27220 isoform X1 [Fragaria vesca subsp. vesca]XP_011461859.1 PREDICTED: probable disease resistance protein At4g27220 isoform X1 [Fragaria vesca subsp. vesca]XP_011461860.1 PREDICTED: probable disease resistance protein A